MRSLVLAIFGAVLILPTLSAADIIYFKDGMRTICQGRAWEEKDEVKCDYDGVILTYRKEDVEHIHQTIIAEETDEPSPAVPATGDNIAPVHPELKSISNRSSGAPVFYDPRRPYKYWSSESAKHHTYREAIEALAREFGRPARWIEERIGDTNNLDRIRGRLEKTEETEKITPPSIADKKPDTGLQFYNPRREYKYQIDASRKFHTYHEAIQALAQEYEVSPQWVESHMGENNEVAVIHQNLRQSKQAIDGEKQ